MVGHSFQCLVHLAQGDISKLKHIAQVFHWWCWLALGTVTMTFCFIAALLFLEIKTEQQQLIIFALGYATAAAQQVLSYYFGSSKSSQDKTAALAKRIGK